MKRRTVATFAALTLALAACASSDDTPDRLTVVATTTILGDVARNVVGEEAAVEVLLPIGADPHDFQLSSQQVAAVVAADLVVVNGLGLEEGLADALAAAVEDGARVFQVADHLDPLPFSGDHDHDDEDETHEEPLDPHVWLDPVRMAEAAGLIAEELVRIDPTGAWTSRADDYAAELRDVDGRIATLVDAIPPADRTLVTNHDALGYFADRYGFVVVDTVIPGGATLAEPSSEDLAALVQTIRTEGVRAIFAEATETRALAEAIAREAGGGVAVVELFTGSLGGPGSGAETLVDLLLTNATRVADALG
jgi:zinc/manganese transport system substrate-binding protein